MRKVIFYFFKEQGKYYEEEPIFFNKDKTVQDIFDYATNECGIYKGMHIVIMFDKDDDIGYPGMVMSWNRKG